MWRTATILVCWATALAAAEPLRWLGGPGQVAGQPAAVGQNVAPGTLLASAAGPAVVELGRSLEGVLTLAPDSRAVASVDGQDLIIRVMAGRIQVRVGGPGTCARVRLRNEGGEVRFIRGLAQVEAGGALVLIAGEASSRILKPDGGGGPWRDLAPRHYLNLPGGDEETVMLRPQLGDLPLGEQAAGRRPPPAPAVSGLDPWQRDDAAVALLDRLLTNDPPAGRIALRTLARWEPAAALLALQEAVVKNHPEAQGLTLEVAMGNPEVAHLAVIGTGLVVPDQIQAICAAVCLALPQRKEAITVAVAAAFPTAGR